MRRRSNHVFTGAMFMAITIAGCSETDRESGGADLSDPPARPEAVPDGQDSQSDPKHLIQAVFSAIESNDISILKELMLPERYDRIEKGLGLNEWVVTWKACKPVEIGQATVALGQDPISMKIRVEYDCNGNKLSDAISLTRINDRWYWDEL